MSAVQTPRPRHEIVHDMKPATVEILFREAVHDLAYAPTPENVRRYLVASRLLDAGTGARNPTRARKRTPAGERSW